MIGVVVYVFDSYIFDGGGFMEAAFPINGVCG
jgi:hypothetical protein